jgi:hypothetical protein
MRRRKHVYSVHLVRRFDAVGLSAAACPSVFEQVATQHAVRTGGAFDGR